MQILIKVRSRVFYLVLFFMASFCHCFFPWTFDIPDLFVVSFFVNNNVKVQMWAFLSPCIAIFNLILLFFLQFVFYSLFLSCIQPFYEFLMNYISRLTTCYHIFSIFFNLSIFTFSTFFFIRRWSCNNQFDFWMTVFTFTFTFTFT